MVFFFELLSRKNWTVTTGMKTNRHKEGMITERCKEEVDNANIPINLVIEVCNTSLVRARVHMHKLLVRVTHT